MTQSFEEAVRQISGSPKAAWLWDVARRRIAFANDAAVSFWDAGSLAELIDRRFADDASARGDAEPARLRDGRPGLVVTAAPEAESGEADDLFAAAPTPLAVFDAQGRRLIANDEARELLMPGELGIVLSSPYAASDLLAAVAADGLVSRILPVATRFGLRRCQIVAKRSGEGATARLIFAFDDIEDRLALTGVPAERVPMAPPAPMEPAPVAAVRYDPTAALEDIIAALPDAALAADAAGRVVAINARASHLLGESAKGEPLLNMLPPVLKGEAAAYIAAQGARWLERSLEEGREIEVQRGGETVPANVTFARVATGEIIVQFRDLTATYKARAALIEAVEKAETASRLKSEYVAGLSHELRTPLNAIIGFAEVMEKQRMGPLENPKYLGYARDIRESGEFLLSLINDLLDLSKAESGRIELDPDAVEIKPIVMSVMSLLTPQAERYGVSLRAALGREVPPVVADARSLKQILLNLAGNAIKFNRSGGEVEIAASLDPAGAVSISVTDDGPGMDADDMKRAMEPYQRGKTGKGREGTGLGLPLARALIEANKAQFAVESAPGKGTTMRITFPSTLVLAE
ncbi:MAG: HAMP domain-containing histidine kinase [Alphaproteobacteria bacterium]|nr:HAMP domain-containing histidine kinase [Alphaproteobacteria bacterium]